MAGLQTGIHLFGIFFLAVMGFAMAIFVRGVARDWAQKRYRNSGAVNAAGLAAVIFVAVLAIWLAMKIIWF